MSMSVLHDLSTRTLPITVTGGETVDAIRVLSLAGHIKASFNNPMAKGPDYARPKALVVELTPQGARMIKRFPRLRVA